MSDDQELQHVDLGSCLSLSYTKNLSLFTLTFDTGELDEAPLSMTLSPLQIQALFKNFQFIFMRQKDSALDIQDYFSQEREIKIIDSYKLNENLTIKIAESGVLQIRQNNQNGTEELITFSGQGKLTLLCLILQDVMKDIYK